MNLATIDPASWIIVCMLSSLMAIFLILGIIFLIKLIRITKEINKILQTGQLMAYKADDIMDNVRNMTSAGNFAKNLINYFLEYKLKRNKK